MEKRTRRKHESIRLIMERYMREHGASTDELVLEELKELLAFNRNLPAIAKVVGFEIQPTTYRQFQEYICEVTGKKYDKRTRSYYSIAD
jgi:hypothetical protein